MTNCDQALALAAQGFHVFPIVAGKKAPPLIADFPNKATTDEEQIREWWYSWPNANLAISTTRYGDTEALLVVDIDNKGGRHGDDEVLRLELEGWTLPDTYRVDTPTGGRHLYYRVDAPVRQGTDLLGRGLDIRSRGGYVVAPGSTVAAGVYTATGPAVLQPAPAWLIERCGQAPAARPTTPVPALDGIDPASARRRVCQYLTDAPLAIEGDGGDQTTFAVACAVKDLGVDAETAVDLLAEHWNPRCQPPWQDEDLHTKVMNAYRYGREPVGVKAPEVAFAVPIEETHAPETNGKMHPFMELNKEYAFVTAGGGHHILWETTDANGRYKLEHLAAGSFQAKFAPVDLTIGKQTKSVADWWLKAKERRSYDGLVFLPEQRAPERFYNLWRGFAYTPAPRAAHPALAAFLDHAKTNICGGDDALCRWLLGYCAHLIQRPWDKPLVALVFRGAKGTGKNAFIERVGALLGGHFLLTSNRRYLLGNFNGHLENCLLFALDEAFWSGDKQAEGALKDLITGREHVIEHKGKEPYPVANKTRVVIIGNEEWLVPASHDERRFAVFTVGDGRKQDRRFFQDMREGMEAGGYPHLLRYLLDYDCTGLDLNAAPATVGLSEQKHHTLDPFQQWWFDCLEEGTLLGSEWGAWPEESPCERFRAAFRRYVKERNIRSRVPEDRAIGKLLKQCAPSVGKKRATKTDEGQPYVYLLPPLDVARSEWDTFMGHPTDWPPE